MHRVSQLGVRSYSLFAVPNQEGLLVGGCYYYSDFHKYSYSVLYREVVLRWEGPLLNKNYGGAYALQLV